MKLLARWGIPAGAAVALTAHGTNNRTLQVTAGRLPNQVVHADLAASNVLVSPDTGAVTGVLDFEMTGYWIRAIELSVALALSGATCGPVAARPIQPDRSRRPAGCPSRDAALAGRGRRRAGTHSGGRRDVTALTGS